MNRFLCLLGVLVSTSTFACPENDLSALNPVTQKVSCLKKWKKDGIVMIVEKECIPCRQLLERMKKEMRAEDKKLVELLWLDTNPVSCLESTLKFGEFGFQWCVNRRDAQEKWQLQSSPVVFWMDNEIKKTQVGRPPEEKRLPWFRFGSRSMLK